MKFAIVVLLAILCFASSEAAIVADHHSPAQLDQVADDDFQTMEEMFNIFYGHTSHGNQIILGMSQLRGENPDRYPRLSIIEYNGDLGSDGSLVWEGRTRDHLATHPETNMVVWSWCGGVSTNTEEGINTYLNAMTQLELDFPEVTFVYMTGHLDGTGDDGNLRLRNNQIREYCLAKDKVLFDFADIESWDPAGNFYPDASDACEWCYDWCSIEECRNCTWCDHSHCFGCYLKGKAFLWLVHQVSGLGISSTDEITPSFSFALSQNSPNPFNPRTEIMLEIQNGGQGTLAVYDLSGKKIASLYEGYFSAGTEKFIWDATTTGGAPLSSGTYFCRLRIGSEVQEIKMTLLK